MNASISLQQRILALRRRQKSYNQIAAALNIAKSTVGYWLADSDESQLIKIRLNAKNRKRSSKHIQGVIKAQRARWAKYRANAADVAREEFTTLLQDPVFTAGIMLYWGEGDSKPKNPLRLSNTDPRMIALFSDFLKNIMNVPEEKIRIGLVLYPDLSDEACKTFWAKTAHLPKSNFVKSQYIKGRHPTKRLRHGICMLVVNSSAQKTKMLTWIDIFAKMFTMKR